MTPDTLAQIHTAAFCNDRPWTAAEFDDLLQSPHTHLTTAPNGFALWRSIAGEAELLTLAVHPAHQGQGVGAQLMHNWMDDAARGAEAAFLEVAADNTRACALYDQFGFATVATRPNYYARAGQNADALVMRAALPFVAT